MRGRAIAVMWVLTLCAAGTAASCIPRPDDASRKKDGQVASAAPPPSAPPAPPPPSIPQRRAAGMVAFQAKDFPRAKAELLHVIAADPNDVEVHFALGTIFEAEGDKPTATHAFLSAAKLDGGKNEIVTLRPLPALMAEGRYDEMLAVLGPARAAQPKSIPIAVWHARVQSARADHAGAEATWRALLVDRPDDPVLHAQLAMALHAGGKAADAKKAANVALAKWQGAKAKSAKEGAGPDELAVVARAFRRVGSPLDAITALSLSPKDTGLTHTERGFARRGVKDAVAAKAQAKKATEVGGADFAPAHLLLAAIAADANEAEVATNELAAYRKLSASSPDGSYDFEEKAVAASIKK